MESRSATILEAVIDEFIKTGKPVSSGEIFNRYDFDIKPATIRLEFAKLTDDGYLEKSYFSAGRIPTDKGYGFFINRIQENKKPNKNITNLVSELINESFDDHLNFIDRIAENLHLFCIGYDVLEKNVYKKGLDELLGLSDWTEVEDFVSIVKDFEKIDERLDFATRNFDGPQIFIGGSPITKSESLSAIIDRLPTEGEDFIVALIGPKRMDYRTNLEFLKEIKRKIKSN